MNEQPAGLPMLPASMLPGGVPPPLPVLRKRRNPTVVVALLVAALILAGLLVPRLIGTPDISGVTPAIVNITGDLSTGDQIAGTGMLLSSSGEVLTNNHVVDGVTNIQVEIASPHRSYPATVVGQDPAHDVAVIALTDAKGLPTIPTDDSNKVSVGDHVSAVGNALGFGGSPTVSQLHIVALNQTITELNEVTMGTVTLTGMLEMNGIVQPGDSGGPLIDSAGRVVGMDTAASRGFTPFSPNMGSAIPIDTALSIARQIESPSTLN